MRRDADRVGPGRDRALARLGGPARRVRSATTRGTVRAYYNRVVRTPARLAPGTYVYALRLTSWANPGRTSVFVSAPFRVGSVWKIQ